MSDEKTNEQAPEEQTAPVPEETPTTEAAPVVEQAEPEPTAEPERRKGSPDVIWGTGRRKSSVARVRVKPGTGRVLVNDRDYKEYFPSLQFQVLVEKPLEATGISDRIDVLARANGGGLTGQAGAMSLGIARALVRMDPSLEQQLREKHLLTRDARMKERKKYGLHGARKGVQFSKR